MQPILVAIAFFGTAVFGLDLTFASGVNCTGQAYYGRRDLPSISCYNMTNYTPTESVILANLDPGETVRFFSDENCQDELYSASSAMCYSESNIMSFQVQTNDKSEDAASSTDIVPYGVRLSNLKGLSQSSPFDVDVNFSTFVTGTILKVLAVGISLSTVATGCIITDTTDVLSLYGCIAAPIATIIALVGSYLIERGIGAGAGPLDEAINMATGTISDVKRELIDSVNFDYMSSIMNQKRGDGFALGEHVGIQARDMGNGVVQRSPLYEVDMGNGGKFHIAAFFDERSGTFTHHLQRAEESTLTARYDSFGKRQISYDDVEWTTNGLDFKYCLFQGSTLGFSSDPATLWQTAYDQFKCEVPPGETTLETTCNNVEVDLYNEAATLVASIQIVPYSGTDTTTGSPPTCASPVASLNEDCVVN